MQIKKIGVLTSGGDSPGMNAAIRSIARSGLHNNIDIAFIFEGFKGLVENKIFDVKRKDVSGIMKRGGTKIGSARLPEFRDIEVRKIAVKNMKENGIDALVVIGGDGSYTGAMKLSEMGIKTIGLPGTIDNDIASTDFTIGFDTALNTIVESVDKIRDTMDSHHRCSIIEVMGRDCGDLAIHAAIATGAEIVVTKQNPISEREIIEEAKKAYELGKRHALIIVTEQQFDVHALAKKVEKGSGFVTRATILGHVQRGGTPSAFDRVFASRLGVMAVEYLLNGSSNIALGMSGGIITATPIDKALKMNRKSVSNLINVVNNTK